ncbi:MAPEG family protein [Noviherbaspirillum galbum]|uniref:MAPEG family protein n=1 Tax=Noviherbaspirillum galbum TaxID=2709383 RepID=A0A6B3SR99_9BURK|nr:MAPEG family protein [Noviherbaspirillum galbum]NEX63297.1 hypothetical protein [Noviherbaspirillum galbum]
MTIALWCIFAAGLLPNVLAALSKVGRPYDNARPREAIEGGWQRRADWAQANAWEAFAPFAAAVLVAHYAHAAQHTVDALALAFIAFRIGHGAAYIGNRPSLRSALWLGGFVCVVGLYVVAARA